MGDAAATRIKAQDTACSSWQATVPPALPPTQRLTAGRMAIHRYLVVDALADWAPKGQTPIIQFHFNWTHISVFAGPQAVNDQIERFLAK